MFNKSDLEEFLSDEGLNLAGPLAASDDSGLSFFVFIKEKSNNHHTRRPGNRALNHIAERAANKGYKLSFVVVNNERNDLDASLKIMLLNKFPDKIRNSFATFENGIADLWLEPKRPISMQEKDAIKSTVSEFLSFLRFELRSISVTTSESLPGQTAILRMLRLSAPCSLGFLSSKLSEKGFTVPNDVWLNHTLDKLRKTGLVVRSKNGELFLSLEGLTRLGTTKSSHSPDIIRALDFAKRGA